jgi:hypothetical protein
MNGSAARRMGGERRRMVRNGAIGAISLLTLVLLAASSAGAAEVDTLLGPPPGSCTLLSSDGVARIPFDLFRGDIRMACRINGRDVRMMLDNGFLWDELLFFGSPCVDSLALKYDGEVDVGGAGEGKTVKSRTASGVTIRFPGVEFYDQPAVVTPYESGLTDMWHGTAGQVSAAFLKHFVVEINFDRMEIVLTPPGKYVYAGRGVEVPMRPLLPGAWGIPVVMELADGRRFPLEAGMDLGQNDALELACVGPHGIGVPDDAIEGSLGFGVQGEIRGYIGRIGAIEIGGYRVENPVADFVPADFKGSVFHEVTIGMDLFSRFNIVYDYPHHRMFFEPSRRFHDKFEYNMSGLSMRKGKGEYLEIVSIVPHSPGEEAGLRIGDKVVRIDGASAGGYDFFALQPLLAREGKTVTLTVSRENGEREIFIKLRRII